MAEPWPGHAPMSQHPENPSPQASGKQDRRSDNGDDQAGGDDRLLLSSSGGRRLRRLDLGRLLCASCIRRAQSGNGRGNEEDAGGQQRPLKA